MKYHMPYVCLRNLTYHVYDVYVSCIVCKYQPILTHLFLYNDAGNQPGEF